MSKEALNTNSHTKEVLSANSFTKEERLRVGKQKSDTGYGRGRFGVSRFGQVSGWELEKEPLNSKIS